MAKVDNKLLTEVIDLLKAYKNHVVDTADPNDGWDGDLTDKINDTVVRLTRSLQEGEIDGNP